MLYALWLGNSLVRRGDGTRPWLRPAIPFAVYVGFAILSIRHASNPSLSVFELFMLVQSLTIFIYIASTVRTREDVVFMVAMLASVVLLESLAMLATYVTKHDFSFAGISTRMDPATSAADNVSRVGGTVGGPNAAAAFLDLLLAPLLAMAIAPVRRSYRLIASVAFMLGVIGLVLTLSRGGWIAVGISCGFVVAYAWSRGWIPGFGPAMVLVGLGLVLFIFRNALLVRFLSNDAGAASSRVPLMVLALHMIRDHPIWGVGANNFGINIARYATPEFGADWLYTVHNKYLLIWAEDGIGALIAFASFLILTLRSGWRCRQMTDDALSLIAVGLTAGFFAQMIHMAVDILNGRQQVQLLVIVAGLIAALVAIKRETDPAPTQKRRWDGVKLPTIVIRKTKSVYSPPRFRSSPTGVATEGGEPVAIPRIRLSNNLRRIASNAASMLASDVINRATTFALYALVARSLGAYEFGQLSLALTLFYTFQILAVAGLKTLITREVAKHRERTDELLVNGSIVILATAFASIAALALFVRVMGYTPDTSKVVLLLSLGLIPYALGSICEAIFQGWERMRLIAIANIPVNVLKIGLSLAVLFLGSGLDRHRAAAGRIVRGNRRDRMASGREVHHRAATPVQLDMSRPGWSVPR